jgi:hypothetical protein
MNNTDVDPGPVWPLCGVVVSQGCGRPWNPFLSSSGAAKAVGIAETSGLQPVRGSDARVAARSVPVQFVGTGSVDEAGGAESSKHAMQSE